jgi:hypothetical protein
VPAPGADVAVPRGPRPATESIALTIGEVQIPFEVAVGDGGGPVFFSLGVRKSGSTLLHKIVNFMANQNGVNLVDVPGTFFRRGFNYTHWATMDLEPMVRPGNLYTGFRAFPTNLADTASYKGALKIFMFRDPRDALVSQYFSDAFSHALPEEGGEGRQQFIEKREQAQAADINEWVLEKVGGLRRTLLNYEPVLSDPKALVLRYEDYVFQKRRLIRKLLEHFGWEVAPAQLEKLLEEVDFVPDAEEKTRFVRKAVPGDHNVKLDAATIKRLNHRLSDVMKMYDY